MIKITNKELQDTKTVTVGAYREFYEHLGYEIVSNGKKPSLIINEIKPKEEIKSIKDKERKESFSRK